MKHSFTAHPWHGVTLGDRAPQEVTAFIEIVPTDVVKYEIEKESGLMKVDRPNKFSSQCPTLYGFLPQTYCGKHIGNFCSAKTGRKGISGDGDPLDICVLAERPIQHGGVLLTAVPIGGLRLIDRDQADDKIIAVLHQDGVYGTWSDIGACPSNLLDRLQHYFLTYKEMPGGGPRKVEIAAVYGAAEARDVILESIRDYKESFGNS
jgi:inorganic pyrophosphatase